VRQRGEDLRLRGPPSRHYAGATVAALALVLATPAAAECRSRLANQLIPLPVYSTLPNEGSTWGVLPVLLRVCPEDQRTESIIAPSLSWNSVIQYTGTFRLYHYPSDVTSLTVIVSVSTRTNYNNLLIWQRLPTVPGESTDELFLRAQRTVFQRFFGLGPDTPASAESSYTSLRFIGNARRGLNIAEHLNLGVTLGLERDSVESIGVPGLPLTPQVFPEAPGIRGATLATQGLDIRYDDRTGGDYAERGFRIDLGGALVEGLSGSPTFLRARLQARAVLRETPLVAGAARFLWSAVSSGRAPFYQQGSLGGSLLLRGFTESRFVDRQAWTFELEQRIRLLQTHIFGVVTDWRVDPFIATGQVFGPFGDVLSRPQLAAGAGFRALVHPNVLGRIDVAYAGEGVKVYVELGYPY
jgi:hypothetical protein